MSQNVAAQKISASLLRTEVKNILPAFLLHVEVVDFLLFIVGWSRKRELMLKRPLGYTAKDIYNVHNFHLIFIFVTLRVSCHPVLLHGGFWCSLIKKCVGHVWLAQHTT